MKSYLSLIPISAKVRRRQNRMTILCIIISVLLVTTIFSMADMAIRMERNELIETHGNWHIMLKNVPEDQVDHVTQRKDVAYYSPYDGLNYNLSEDYAIQGKRCVVAGADASFLTKIYSDLTEGRYPEKTDEILLSNGAKDLLSLKIGDVVELHTPSGNAAYRISGFGGDVTITADADVVGGFVNWDSLQSLAAREGKSLAPVCFIRFADGVNVRSVVQELKETYGFTDQTLAENTALMGLTGFSSDSYVMGIYFVAAVLFVLVLAAGSFMIAATINNKTAERTQFFGMLRCIGASRAQIMHIVRLEALYWCRLAIPVGVGLGILCTWGLCALLRFGVGAEFIQIPLWNVSGIGILCGIIVGILTVLLSSISPARRAASVSPIAAVTGNLSQCGISLHPLKGRQRNIEVALGIHHATSSPKNLFLMTGSFALNIVLILCFSVLVQWVHMALNPLKPWAPDVFYSCSGQQAELEKDFAAKVADYPYVQRAFGRMYDSIPATYERKNGQIDLISYEENQFHWAQEDLISGSLSDVINGNGVLTVFDKSNTLQVGDSIQLAGREFIVAGVLEDSPFDTSDSPTVICSENTFQAITGKDTYAVIDVQLSKTATEAQVKELHSLAEGRCSFYDRLAQNKDTTNTYYMFCIFVYGFLMVVALITVIHTINSLAMSVSARVRQYGVMRAVGMDGTQIQKMITAEALTDTVLGLFAGFVFGLPLHYLFYTRMITHYWGTEWEIPLAVMGGIFLFLLIFAVLASIAPVKRIRKMEITETINEL